MSIAAHVRLAAAMLAAASLLFACMSSPSGPIHVSPPNPGGPPGVVVPPNPGTPGPDQRPGGNPGARGDDPVTSPPSRPSPSPPRPSPGDTGPGDMGPGGAGHTGNWRLESINGVSAGFAATLRLLPAGEVRGEGPCNSYTAQAQGRPPALRLADLRATERASAEMAAEMRFFEALAAVDRMAMQGDRLVLSGPAGRQLVFRR